MVAATALVAAACAGPGGEAPESPPSSAVSTTTGTADPTSDGALRGRLYGLALARLVTADNTFGEGFRFSEILIQSSTDPEAGGPDRQAGRRALTDAERAGIEAALAPLGSLRWIDDPDRWRTPDLQPRIEGSAIVGVGEIRLQDGDVLVPVSLWCGGLCGLWATYRLTRDGDGWKVVGFDGPVTIS